MLIGYARVSIQNQNVELQREALPRAGCEKIFKDKISVAQSEHPGLTRTIKILRAGNTLVVWRLDRLGRSVKQLIIWVSDLQAQGVQFHSLTDAIDTGTTCGRFFFNIMASLAQMVRKLNVERTRAGLAVVRQPERKGGRRHKTTESKLASARTLLAGRMLPKDVANNLGVSVATLYRWLPASTRS